MAENVTLGTVSSFTNDSSAVATVNANSALIETAFEDCLSLAGGQPNQMQSNLDMNNNQVINLPAPSTVNSPVRVTDLATFSNSGTITFNTLPAGGSQNAVLHKNSNSDYDATFTLTPSGLTSIGATSSTVTTSNVTGTSVYSGSSSGTTTLQASATASGTVSLPAATDTLVGKATTDTLTNKTLDTAGTGNVIKFGGVTSSTSTGTGAVVLGTSPTITTPGIVGVTNASNATAGNVGEYLESIVTAGSAVSLTSTTAKDITTLTLTAGDWDVSGNIAFIGTTSTSLSAMQASISTTLNTVDTSNGRSVLLSAQTLTNANTITTLTVNLPIGPLRFNVNGSTTLHLVANSQFAASTLSGYGLIRARRIR